MNRELKFRAWDKERKLLREVCSIEFDDTGRKELVKYWDHASLEAAKIKAKIATVWKENVELMQYTGLKDKNGVEIYEGDIVRDEVGIAVVYFIAPGFVAVDKDNNQWWVGAGKSYPLGHNHLVSTEVIGSIHENPELLNK